MNADKEIPMGTDKSYIDRVIQERAYLGTKMGRLSVFLGSAAYDGVPRDERDRLRLQYKAMEMYWEILDVRIEAAGR